MNREEMLHRLGEIRDAIEGARASQDTAALFDLTGERDRLRAALNDLQAPPREDIEKELASLRAQLGAFDPEVGMLTGMSMVGSGQGPGAASASSVKASAKAARQQREDAGVTRVEQRIAHLEAVLRRLESS